MTAIPPTLSEAVLRFKHVASDIQEAFEAKRPNAVAGQLTPASLFEAVDQFLTIATRIDKEEGETARIYKEDVTQLGDYGMTLMTDLSAWAGQLKLPNTRHDLEIITLAATDWIMRHQGQIRTLDPIVNALANIANRVHDPSELGPLAAFMGRIVKASSNIIKQDLEKNNPSRPWRVLLINRGIVATRTHNPALMEQVFDELVKYLPEDAPTFFAEGMQQMEALNYPPPVRVVMGRYFDRWTRPRMH